MPDLHRKFLRLSLKNPYCTLSKKFALKQPKRKN